MVYYNLIFFISVLGLNFSFSQSTEEWGARSAGMGNSTVAVSDKYSGFNNVAGLGQQNQTAFLLGFKNNFGISSFNGTCAGVNLPVKKKITSVTFARFGDNTYNEQALGVGLSHQLNFVSLGFKAELLQQHVDEIITRRNIAIALGGLVKITRQLSFGSYVWNISQAKKQHSDMYLPTILKAGFAYCKDKKLTISTEIYKSTEQRPDLRIGLEYYLADWVAFRTGITTKPFKICFGTGIRKKTFSFDYAFNNHPILGNIHQLSLAYSLQ